MFIVHTTTRNQSTTERDRERERLRERERERERETKDDILEITVNISSVVRSSHLDARRNWQDVVLR